MRCIDLFSGCGGMSRGFIDAGFDVVAAFDNWDSAIQCYERNFKHPIYKLDLSNWQEAVNIIRSIECDIIFGGPPCQDFSHAGKRIEGERAGLTICFAKIVGSLKPKFFVMENVDRALSSNAYAEARKIFKEAGYGLTERVINAAYCGVPQKRKRFFCIGGLGKADGFLNGLISSGMSELPMTVKDYLGNRIDIDYYYRHPRTYKRRGIFSVYEPAPTIRGSNRPMPPDYKKHAQDATDPSNGVRALTFIERALLQTFPDEYQWLDSVTVNNQLIGNAVPVKLAFYVAECLMKYISNNYNIRDIGFVEWLKAEKKYTERAAEDVLSRLRRMLRRSSLIFLEYSRRMESNRDNIDDVELLSGCSKTVKSQLKRAQALYDEYLLSCRKHGG